MMKEVCFYFQDFLFNDVVKILIEMFDYLVIID